MLIFASTVMAQTMETNIPGLVVKDYICNLKTYVEGNLLNRTTEPFQGRVRVKIIDKDGDILFQTAKAISVGAQNGARIEVYISVGNCLAPNKVQITLER
jgi:hypothetical protein